MTKGENVRIYRFSKDELGHALEMERPRTAKEHLRKLLAEVESGDHIISI